MHSSFYFSLEFTIPIDPSNYNFVDFKNLLSNYLINLVLYCTVLFFCTLCISVTLGCTYTSVGYLYTLPMAEFLHKKTKTKKRSL